MVGSHREGRQLSKSSMLMAVKGLVIGASLS